MTKISPAATNFVVRATTNEKVTILPLVNTVKSPADSSSVLTPGPGKHNISWAQPFPPKIIDGGGEVVWSLQKEHSTRSDTNISSRHGFCVSNLDGSVGSTNETISPFEKARIAANELKGVTLCFTRHTERPAQPSMSWLSGIALVAINFVHGVSGLSMIWGTKAGWTFTASRCIRQRLVVWDVDQVSISSETNESLESLLDMMLLFRFR